MQLPSWLDDAILYIYALSLVFYSADVFGRYAYAKRAGTGLLFVVWLLQAAVFLERTFDRQYVPIVTLFETMFFFSWVLVTFALVLLILFRQEVTAFFMCLPGFAVLLFGHIGDPLLTPTDFSEADLNGGLLIVHIAFAFGSYALFTLSAVFSALYLFLHRKLKEKLWSSWLRRLPSLVTVETYAYRTAVIGCGMLLISLFIGAFWIRFSAFPRWILDPKVLVTVWLFVMYAAYAAVRKSPKTTARRLALWNLSSYAVIMVNLMVSNYMSEFHDWIWME